MNKPYHVLKTVKLALSDEPVQFTSTGADLRIFSDRACHFGNDLATENDLPIAADHPEFVSGGAPDQVFSLAKATGETDGTVWVSHIKFV